MPLVQARSRMPTLSSPGPIGVGWRPTHDDPQATAVPTPGCAPRGAQRRARDLRGSTMNRSSIQQELERRDEIPDDDIEALICRAIDLEAAGSRTEGISVEELVAMGEELEIAPEFIERAIAERYPVEEAQLEQERRTGDREVTTRRTQEGSASALPVLALVAVAAVVVLSWFMFSTVDAPPPSPAAATPTAPPDPPEAVRPDKRATPPVEPTVQPPEPRPEPRPQPAAVAAMTQTIRGEWILDAYRGSRNGRIIDVPVAADRLDADRERWSIRPGGHYSRRLSSTMGFSGAFSLRPAAAHMKIHDAEGATFIMHGRNVTSTLAGLDRPEDFFLVAMVGDDLVVHYVGTTLAPFDRFPDGARFRRAR